MIKKINTYGSSLFNGKIIKFITFSLALIFSFDVGAQDAAEIPAVTGEVAYILNTFLFLVCGFLVMFMAAGFFACLKLAQLGVKTQQLYV